MNDQYQNPDEFDDLGDEFEEVADEMEDSFEEASEALESTHESLDTRLDEILAEMDVELSRILEEGQTAGVSEADIRARLEAARETYRQQAQALREAKSAARAEYRRQKQALRDAKRKRKRDARRKRKRGDDDSRSFSMSMGLGGEGFNMRIDPTNVPHPVEPPNPPEPPQIIMGRAEFLEREDLEQIDARALAKLLSRLNALLKSAHQHEMAELIVANYQKLHGQAVELLPEDEYLTDDLALSLPEGKSSADGALPGAAAS